MNRQHRLHLNREYRLHAILREYALEERDTDGTKTTIYLYSARRKRGRAFHIDISFGCLN